ncbi:hypothetical protein Stube_45650 [Streptomyces tubercidicus]|uniref:Uncharacterized protein n=1 Tax=Streptomyces tubercidicus TaxID=47759 RepID=A0A640UWX7_9ACTN|nr:hypothetical protein Stube_45650 [Streptomyces tubercidicus]
MPHRNCTHSGSRSRTALHARSPRRAPGGSPPGGGGPVAAASPASPKIAATRARTFSRSHSRRSAPPDGAAAPSSGTERADPDDTDDADKEPEGADATEEPKEAKGTEEAEEGKEAEEAEGPASEAEGPAPSPKAPADAGNPHEAARYTFIPTDAKHPAQISPSSLKSGG